MKNLADILKYFVLILIVSVLTAIVYGCGGGGGGGGVPAGITYSGLTTPALIDENNAETLSLGVYTGGDISGDLIITGAVLNDEPGIDTLNFLSFDQQIKNALFNIDLGSRTTGIYAGATYTDSQTINGSCGGSYLISVTIDDVTGNYNGDLQYSNYCENGLTLHGPITFSGTFDLNKLTFINMFMTANNVTSSNGVETVTISGDMDTVFHDGLPLSLTFTINSLIKYSSTSKVYKLQDYQMIITDGTDGEGDFVQVVLTGKYYDPDYGYVDITTPNPLKIYFLDMFPSEGIVILDGENGSVGGSTKARFTAINDTSYMVEADTTGDGVYDYNSGATSW